MAKRRNNFSIEEMFEVRILLQIRIEKLKSELCEVEKVLGIKAEEDQRQMILWAADNIGRFSDAGISASPRD